MNIPKYIKQAIVACAEANEIARENDAKVRDWLEQKGLVDEDFNNTSNLTIADSYIDSVELTNNSMSFIKQLEELN